MSSPSDSVALFLIDKNGGEFTEEFKAYLPQNLHVWAAFEREAFRVIRRGFKRYSARTIIEVLRHHSALTQVGGPWKLNDWHTPYLARLFMMVHPKHEGFFELRDAKATRKVAA